MTRHSVDWLSLIVGALGVLVAVSSLTDLRLGAIVGDVGPLAAVIVGLAVLGAALRGVRSPQPASQDHLPERPTPESSPAERERAAHPATDDDGA